MGGSSLAGGVLAGLALALVIMAMAGRRRRRRTSDKIKINRAENIFKFMMEGRKKLFI